MTSADDYRENDDYAANLPAIDEVIELDDEPMFIDERTGEPVDANGWPL